MGHLDGAIPPHVLLVPHFSRFVSHLTFWATDTRHGGERHYHSLAIDKANRSMAPAFQTFRDNKVVKVVGKPLAVVGKPMYSAGKAVTKTAINTTKTAAGYLYKGAAMPLDYTGKLLDISYSLMTADDLATAQGAEQGLSAREQQVCSHRSTRSDQA